MPQPLRGYVLARDDGLRGGGRNQLLIGDEDGTAKACTRKRYPPGEILRMADRLPVARLTWPLGSEAISTRPETVGVV